MILHTINKTSAWQKCAGIIADQDKVLLLEDGVFLALSELEGALAIRDDVEARGLLDRISSDTRLIDYQEFVRLSTEADKVCAWF